MTESEQLSPEERKKRISAGMKKFHARKKAMAKPNGSLKQTGSGILEELRRERAELDRVIEYLEKRS